MMRPYEFRLGEIVEMIRELSRREQHFAKDANAALVKRRRFKIIGYDQTVERIGPGHGPESKRKLLNVRVAWFGPLENDHTPHRVREHRFVYHEVPMNAQSAQQWQQHLIKSGFAAHLVLGGLKQLRQREYMPPLFSLSMRCLVYEDVRCRGFDRVRLGELNVEHLKAACRALARLHASACLADAERKTGIRDVFGRLMRGRPFSPGTIESNLYEKHIRLVEGIAEKLEGRVRTEIREALQLGFFVLDMWQDHASRRPGLTKLPEVLSIGPNCLYYLLFDTASPPNCLLGFTNRCYYAPRTLDLANFLYTNLPRAERDACAPFLLAVYLKEFNECVKSNEPTPGTVPVSSVELLQMKDLEAEYEALKLPAMFFGLCSTPYIMLGCALQENYPRPHEQQEFHRKYFVEDRGMMEFYETDKRCSERMNELVGELLEYIDGHDLTPEFEGRHAKPTAKMRRGLVV